MAWQLEFELPWGEREFDVTVTKDDGETTEYTATLETEGDEFADYSELGEYVARVPYGADCYVDRKFGLLLLNDSVEFNVRPQTLAKNYIELDKWGNMVHRYEKFATFKRGGKEYLVNEISEFDGENGQKYFWLHCTEILGEVHCIYDSRREHRYIANFQYTFADEGRKNAVEYILQEARRLEQAARGDWWLEVWTLTLLDSDGAEVGAATLGHIESDMDDSGKRDVIHELIMEALPD